MWFNRLDQILGKQGSKAKDVYASKISLASRVVKIERQVSGRLTKIIRVNFFEIVGKFDAISVSRYTTDITTVEFKLFEQFQPSGKIKKATALFWCF